MPIVDNNVYKDIGVSLEAKYKGQIHQYLYSQNYLKSGSNHPFDPIVPLTDKFFGPKVLSILIVSQTYNLPNPDSDAALDTIRKCYDQWTKYQVHIYVDLVLALKIFDATSDDTYLNQMNDLATSLQSICENDMKNYGFIWKGKLSVGVDANYFSSEIDQFYKEE